MAKKLQLQVPTPCHENWDNMTQTERGRFCAACQKQVIDFSNKSDREIAMFFKKPSSGSVCGRFMEDQLNRDFEIPKKRIPWLKYFFQFLIPAFFISYRATAQGKVKVVSNTTTQPTKLSNEVQTKKPVNGSDKKSVSTISNIPSDQSGIVIKGDTVSFRNLDFITGKVIDEKGQPISYATVAIKGTKIAVVADSAGTFTIHPKQDWKKVTLSVSCVGFAPLEKNLRRSDERDDVEIKLQQTGALGEVIVTSTIGFRKGLVCRGTIIRSYNDSILKTISQGNFRIYPNPIRSNSTLTIEWKQKEYGDHLLQLFNQSGQLVFSKNIYVDDKARSFTMNMPTIISGNYFVKLTSKEAGKSYTEKLFVE